VPAPTGVVPTFWSATRRLSVVSPLAIRPGERHRQHVQRGELHLLGWTA
jgi:hypothetical protein